MPNTSSAQAISETGSGRVDRKPALAVPTTGPADHVPVLDGLRGLAILLVLLFHQNLLGKAGFNEGGVRIFNGFTELGWCGVNLFFVLSGFLITRILHRERLSAGYFGRFYFRRTVRIFPLYYAVLFVTLVVLPNLPSEFIPAGRLERFSAGQVSPGWYWLYLSNFAMAARGEWGHGILDVAWSLSIEEQFYLLWPLAVRFAGRRELMRLCLLLMGLAFGIRVAMTFVGVSPVAIYLLTPSHFDPLAAGAFLALALEAPGQAARIGSWMRTLWPWTTALLAVLFLWRGTSNMDPWNQTFGFALLAVQFAIIIALAQELPALHPLHRVLSSRLLRAFGRYSYAIYLFHLPVRGIVRDFIFGPRDYLRVAGSPIAGQLLFYALTTAITMIAAYASWHLFEVHFLKLKRFAPPPSPPRDDQVRAGAGGQNSRTRPGDDKDRALPAVGRAGGWHGSVDRPDSGQ